MNKQIATGQYATREEVIAAGLHLLRDTDARRRLNSALCSIKPKRTSSPDESHLPIHSGRPAVKAAATARLQNKP